MSDIKPIAWALKRSDGLVLDVICPGEHDNIVGDYTTPLYPQSALDAQAAEIERLQTALESASTLINQCRAALAEELASWDIDPPLHHVFAAHAACVSWLALHASKFSCDYCGGNDETPQDHCVDCDRPEVKP